MQVPSRLALAVGLVNTTKIGLPQADDAAATIHLPAPHPDEVKGDIDRLDTWRLKVESRKDATAVNRK